MRNNEINSCPNCGVELDNEVMQCATCRFEPNNRKDLWKPANMGKQRIKPVNNRTGKKQSIATRLHHH